MDLIFVNPNKVDKDEKEGQATKTFHSKFPDSGATMKVAPPTQGTAVAATVKSAAITPSNPSCAPHMDKIMGLYDNGFDSLNLEGYDFYEYFKGIIANADNPSMFLIAFQMAKGMDPNVTKERLLEQSQYYIDEITKVHTGYAADGSSKSEETLRLKAGEESSLTLEISSIDAELRRLTEEKKSKEVALSGIDAKYSTQITDVQCKIMANDMAKESIVGSIMKVVNGIKKHI